MLMKNKILFSVFSIQILLLWSTALEAQQLPIAIRQLLLSDPMNPGQVRTGVLNGTFFAIQTRTRQGTGWRSTSQFLHFHGRPQGGKGIFRWGANVTNDIEHTENRLAIAPIVSVQLLSKEKTQFQLGIMTGFVSWSSNYRNRSIYDPEDPVALDQTNLIEVNTGVGGSLRRISEKGMLEAGAWVSQLTGNLISSPLEGIRLFPSLRAEGAFLFPVSSGIYMGPRLYYNEVMGEEVEMGLGKAHFGVVARMPERQLWAGATVSAAPQVFNLGFGFPVITAKKEAQSQDFQQSLDLNVGLRYPLGSVYGFGPSLELGLAWNFGRDKTIEIDTLPFAKPFWSDESSMVSHKQQFLDPVGPLGLEARQMIYDKDVFVEFEFPDRSRQYCGTAPSMKEGLVRRAGYEWQGIDGLARGLVSHVIEPALHPDSTKVRDPENLEALRHVAWVEVGCQLRVDEYGAQFSSEMPYEGEFGTNDSTNSVLMIPVVLDDRDTVIQVTPRQFTSNLELAALKLFVIRDRIQYELEQQYGKNFRVIREEDLAMITELEEAEDWRIKIVVRTPRITSDNSNLQAFQQNTILLKFPRKPEFWREEDKGWIDVEEKDELDEWEKNGEDVEED